MERVTSSVIAVRVVLLQVRPSEDNKKGIDNFIGCLVGYSLRTGLTRTSTRYSYSAKTDGAQQDSE